MSDDDQLKAVIAIKQDMVVNTGWQIVCENAEVSKFTTESLLQIGADSGLDAGFDDVLRDMLSSYRYGFSLTEPVYEIREGKYHYKALKTRPPHTFFFVLDERGNVMKVKQVTTKGELELEPKLFLHHVYQMEFGNPYGKSDFRAAHAPYKAKLFIQKFMNIYLERFATPTVVGKFQKNMTDQEIARFHAMLKTIQNSTTLTIPDEAVVEFVQAQRDATTAYKLAIDLYNQEMARAILVPDLLGLGGGETSGGSFALGKEHFKVFFGTIKKDRESLARKITMKLVAPMVRANFGEKIEARFEFLPFQDDQVIENVKVWSEAARAKVFEPNDEEVNHLRKLTGFPEGPVNRPAPPPSPFGDPDALGRPGEPGKGPRPRPKPARRPEEDPDDEGKKEFADGAPRRALKTYEAKMDYPAVREQLDRAEAALARAMAPAAADIARDFVQQIVDKAIVRSFKPEKIKDLQPRFLKEMNRAVQDGFTRIFRKSLDQAQKEIFREVPARYADEDVLLPEEFLQILKAESFKVVGDYSFEISKRARNILTQAIKDGVGEAETVRLIRDELKDVSERWIATVARTKTTEIYNDARKAYWDTDPIASQIVEAYEFSAILDERTSDVCRELDGKIFEKGAFITRVTPPLHFNCRSLLVPVTRFEAYADDPDFVKRGKEPNLERLQDLGGRLIVYAKFETVSRILDHAGDHEILHGAPAGFVTRVHSIFCSNSSPDKAATISVGREPGQPGDFRTYLRHAGGKLEKVFRDPLELPAGTPLVFHVENRAELNLTVEYDVVEVPGGR